MSNALFIPSSLIDGILRHRNPIRVRIVDASDGSDCMLVAAHPADPSFGWVVFGDENPFTLTGSMFVIKVRADSSVVFESDTLPAFDLCSVDIDDGKDFRRKEVTGSDLFNPDDNVLFIGLGSLGSTALNMLVRSGWCNFTLLDPDAVEFHNQTKSMVYVARDAGFKKTDILEYYIRSIEPGASVTKVSLYFNEESIESHIKPLFEDVRTRPKLVFLSADSQVAVCDAVDFFASIEDPPFVIFHLLFTNALAGFTVLWDPADKSSPCPNCLFAEGGITDPANSDEAIDPTNYSPFSVRSSPQLVSDISFHTSLAVSYAIGILTGNPERLSIVAAQPWLYSVALRYPPSEIDWIDKTSVGKSFAFPERPDRPLPGCACCRKAGRVSEHDLVLQWGAD